MSRENIYAISSGQTAQPGAPVPLTSVVRRLGCALALDNPGISLQKVGYYHVTGAVTFTSTAGTAGVSVYQDGSQVPGATSSLTAVTDTTYSLAVDAMVRVKCPCQAPSQVTLVSGPTTIVASNAAMTVEYLG